MQDVPVPKYYVLKKAIIDMIDAAKPAPNEPIMSEREMVDKFNFSRITVRKAIDELVREGYLYRVQGKGTFVLDGGIAHDLYSLSSCTDDIVRYGMKPSRRIISASVGVPDTREGRLLRLSPDEPVFRLERVYYADGVPINYTTTYLPYKYIKGIERFNFEAASLYETLKKEYCVELTKSTRTLEAVSVKGGAARYLEMDDGAPIIMFRAVTYGRIRGGAEIPVETFESAYRTDKFKFFIEQVGQQRKG
ncbi:MAG: GntR family transcriptional regulator [Clostridiales bacterium]|jgi:GntR family transcriptional regulator|nr:GntR family transcriptional regulator [Clostridiales bacterium]